MGGGRVRKGFEFQSSLFEPLAGAQVQPGLLLRGALAQELGKQVVVAIPAPLVVQRDDEQVGAFEEFQGLLPGDSRVELRSKKAWMLSGCCCKTSSSR